MFQTQHRPLSEQNLTNTRFLFISTPRLRAGENAYRIVFVLLVEHRVEVYSFEHDDQTSEIRNFTNRTKITVCF